MLRLTYTTGLKSKSLPQSRQPVVKVSILALPYKSTLDLQRFFLAQKVDLLTAIFYKYN